MKTCEDDENKVAYALKYDVDGSTKYYWVVKTISTSMEKVEVKSTAAELQDTISSWYGILRDIAVVVLLSVLVYTGIKIVISSTGNDKAKYKERLVDWVVAICLLFVMQYIMSFANILNEKIVDIVNSITESDSHHIAGLVTYETDDQKKKILTEIAKYKYDTDSPTDAQIKELENDEYLIDSENKTILWQTNLMGIQRLSAQRSELGTADYFGNVIAFVILVLFTVFFVFTYLRRVLYMAFLTLIAPLVAMTYPIDKMNDGKAQAFDMWFKEYIFNLLIQPMHLVLYTVLVTSAVELADTHVIYTIVAIGFMIPAEKLMRRFFGFEKAQTPGLLAGPAGAALAMTGLNKMFSGGQKKKGGSSDDKKTDEKDTKVRMQENTDPTDEFLKDSDNNNGGDDSINTLDAADDNEPVDEEGIDMADGDQFDDASDDDNIDTMHDAETLDAANDEEVAEQINEAVLAEELSNNDEDNDDNYYIDESNDSEGEEKVQSAENDEDVEKKKIKTPKVKVEPKTKKSPQGLRNALRKSSRYYAKGMAEKLSKRGAKNLKAIPRRAARMAGGAFLGASLAGAGLALGAASGDPTKAFQYTTGAAFGGYKLGKNSVDNTIDDIKDTFGVSGTGKQFSKAYYGDQEYKNRQIQKRIKDIQRDAVLREKLVDKIGKERTEEFMDEGIRYYVTHGIDDTDSLVAVAKMEKDGEKRSQVLGAALMAERYADGKDTNALGSKADAELNKTLYNDFRGNDAIETDEQAAQSAYRMRDLMNGFSAYKNDSVRASVNRNLEKKLENEEKAARKTRRNKADREVNDSNQQTNDTNGTTEGEDGGGQPIRTKM